MPELRRTARERGKAITCVHLIRQFCHVAKTPKRWSCQTQLLSPSKSVQYAGQKSSLNSSVLEGASTARLFLIGNSKPDVQHILGNSKHIPTAAGPDLLAMKWDHVLLGALSSPGAAPCLPPLLPVVLGRQQGWVVCAPNLSLPHPGPRHR